MFDLFPLVVGFLGSVHCLGMCGPLVLAYSIHLTKGETNGEDGTTCAGRIAWRRDSAHHLAFHAGRLLTYGLLGAVAAGLFQAAGLSRFYFSARNGLMLFGGTLLILLALVICRVIPIPSPLADFAAAPATFLGRHFHHLFRSRSIASKILLGMATGTVPCCLSWAMIVTAASSQNPVTGGLTMVIFGLGTVPALFFTGLSASVLSRRMRFLGERAAALLVLGMGVMLILRGVGILA